MNSVTRERIARLENINSSHSDCLIAYVNWSSLSRKQCRRMCFHRLPILGFITFIYLFIL